MTDKEKKTIELLNKYTDRNFPCDSCKYCSERPNVNYSIKILLNLIEKQQKELEKKDKIINKLIGLLTGKGLTAWDNEKKEQLILIHAQEILEYFTNLVEKEDK